MLSLGVEDLGVGKVDNCGNSQKNNDHHRNKARLIMLELGHVAHIIALFWQEDKPATGRPLSKKRIKNKWRQVNGLTHRWVFVYFEPWVSVDFEERDIVFFDRFCDIVAHYVETRQK